nr:unnamed protein product [Callosobruchus chinensis]
MPNDADVCSKCSDNFIISSKSIDCDGCHKQFHPICVNIKDNFCKFLSECANAYWFCHQCNKPVNLQPKSGGADEGTVTKLQIEFSAIKCEKDLLEKLVDELDNSSRLQKFKIESLEKELCTDKNSALDTKTSGPNTYSNVVKTNNNVNKNSQVLLIKPTDKKSTEDILKNLSQSINPANINVCINGTRKIRDGVAVFCHGDSDLKKLKDAVSSGFGDRYILNEGKKQNPRLIINNAKGVNTISDDQLIDSLCTLNDLRDVNRSDIRVVTRLNSNDNQSIVLEVSAAVRKLLIHKGNVCLGWNRCSVEDYVRVLQCYKCSGFGHLHGKCKSDLVAFPKCSGEHTIKNCTSDNRKCANCNSYNKTHKASLSVDHSAWSHSCPWYLKTIEELKSRVDYGRE